MDSMLKKLTQNSFWPCSSIWTGSIPQNTEKQLSTTNDHELHFPDQNFDNDHVNNDLPSLFNPPQFEQTSPPHQLGSTNSHTEFTIILHGH